ncbi:MAG: penicillin acylase family protein [Bacteroidota bacterium]
MFFVIRNSTGPQDFQQRLFQMDLSTRAAAGRVSEILGASAVPYDKKQRRLGMVLAAENTLAYWQKQSEDYPMIEAYVNGVNAYIKQLTPRDYPLEYKLLGFEPELWTPLRVALLMKNMDLTLCAREYDMEATNALKAFGRDTFDFLFPLYNPQNSPIIPAGTNWNFDPIALPNDSLSPSPALYGDYRQRLSEEVPNSIGSNNWAVSGQKTASGKPILCNDPHLILTLPSIWFEVQLHLPDFNVYGVSLPGFPGVTIGFNEYIAWGMTNVGHDVMDWYRIDWTDESKSRYRYEGAEKEVEMKVERIRIKGKPDVLDTVRYTIWGPIASDNPENNKYDLAVRWLPHDGGGDEARLTRKISMARNYDDYRDAIKSLRTPAQNFLFADVNGDIGLTVQGQLPLKRSEQGRFVQDGSRASSAWAGYIPYDQVPAVKNPERGFVSSANQRSTDDSYPYAYHGNFADFRGRYLNRRLESMEKIKVEDMMKLQNDNFSLKAEQALPLLLQSIAPDGLNGQAKELYEALKSWDYRYDVDSKAASYFDIWWRAFYKNTWDEMEALEEKMGVIDYPESWRTIALLAEDPENAFFDDKRSPAVETAADMAQQTFEKLVEKVAERTDKGKDMAWGNYRKANFGSLTRLPAFSISDKQVPGDRAALNANSGRAGPSWRMIVEMGDRPKGYGVYPGGQSGNPGSRFYDDALDHWLTGKYYELNFWPSPPAEGDESVLYRANFQN